MTAMHIDFKELRKQLSFAAILEHYGATLKQKGGDQWHGYCPLPTHASKNSGKPKSPSFSANVGKGIWQCFGCGAKGNLMDFAARMEGLDPDNPKDFRKAALILKRTFLGAGEDAPAEKPATTKEEKTETAEAKAADELPEVVNAPLNFSLTGLDFAHPYLRERGFSDAMIERFGLGYCNRGLMKGRIAIPLHNQEGVLIGYAGRIIDDSKIGDDNPKYRLPGDRIRDGTKYVFHKSAFLYNGSAIDRSGLRKRINLVLVEGFPSVWWLTQHGITNVVATMGASLSEEQAAILTDNLDDDDRVWIMPDGDAAGERMAESALKLLAPHCFVRWVRLDDDKQPTDYTKDALLDRLFEN